MKKSILLLVVLFGFKMTTHAGTNDIHLPADSARILYTGYSNMVVIPEGSKLIAPSCSLKKNTATTYNLVVPATLIGKKTPVEVQLKSGKKIKFSMHVKPLPVPTLCFGQRSLGEKATFNKQTFTQLSKLKLVFGYGNTADIRVNFTLSSYKLVIKSGGKEHYSQTVTTGTIPADAAKLFSELSSYTISFSEIKASGSGVDLRGRPVVVTVTN
ncbi:MAG TPA: hypothetical protein VK177_08870 [Flavobacteriales bacterium]|nr:hypothetical protein [Flavobacteriales bacterium]